MKSLLYLGADDDLTPIISYPDIKQFVYVDQLPRNYHAHYGIKYYKGIYIPQYVHSKKDMVQVLVDKMKKQFQDILVRRDGDKLEIRFEKNRTLTYWLNTLLPTFTAKNQFKKIKEVDGKEKYDYYDSTNLTKEIIDSMLKCNVLFIKGYYPAFPILRMLKVRTIITPSYILEYHHSSKDGFSSGKKYGEIDLRKVFSEKNLILDEKLHESS